MPRLPRLFVSTGFLCLVPLVAAQNDANTLSKSLLKRPLYLRSFCGGSKIDFDRAGKPTQPCKVTPLTLSGMDVLSVHDEAGRLYITAQRMVLVADSDGRLERKVAIGSRTHIFGSLMPGNRKNYDANEEVHITVEADNNGNFDTALHGVFADGLADLAANVPFYWQCYAEGYFVENRDMQDADKIVDRCIEQKSFERRLGTDTADSTFMQPRILNTHQPPATIEAIELGVSGKSTVHFSVSQSGIPVGFQIVHALGAGLDEATLTALSQSQFQPATIHGDPVVADLSFTMSYQVEQ